MVDRRLVLQLLIGVLGASLASAAAPAPAPNGTAATASAKAPDDPADIVGKTVPPWHLESWLNSPSLTLDNLRGKVVLVRWFTDSECPFCTMSAPALNRLHRNYSDGGLVVVGAYHYKGDGRFDPKTVPGVARGYGFRFPVAVDPDWRTLKSWWLDGKKREFTSVSILLDRRGVVRHVHKGGTLALGSAAYTEMQKHIEDLLPAPAPKAKAKAKASR